MLDWLGRNTNRLQDVYWWLENEDGGIRDAIADLADEDDE
jgi:hypothetical protein